MKRPDNGVNAAQRGSTDEERKGLLWDEKDDIPLLDEEVLPSPRQASPARRRCIAISVIVLLLGAVFTPACYYASSSWKPRPVADFDSQKLRSNGTHWFKKTALIVSIDGLQYVACIACLGT